MPILAILKRKVLTQYMLYLVFYCQQLGWVSLIVAVACCARISHFIIYTIFQNNSIDH